jgi:Cu+-exporting ATPase
MENIKQSNFIDPVCGMTVQESERKFIYENETYYFCSDSCLAKFSSSPADFLKKEEELHSCCSHHAHNSAKNDVKTARKINLKNATYTCPMHPEIEQDHAGICPKCGMALEAKGIPAAEEDLSELNDMKHRFFFAAILSLPLLLIAMDEMIPFYSFAKLFDQQTNMLIQFILATPVVLYSGYPFFQRAFASVVNKSLNMFTLIGLGTGIAYLFSIVAAFFPSLFPAEFAHSNGSVAVYFEASAIIITLILLGQVLELKARSQTNSAIKLLLNLSPKIAHKVTGQGDEDIDIELVLVNDILRVKPGEKIPVDGVLLEGTSFVDESMISGEALPVKKEPESKLIAGTLNAEGSFTMKAVKVGSETVLSQIVQMVSEAQRSRAPIQKQVDKISSYFVPAVILTSIATFVIWSIFGPSPKLAYGLINAVAVLIIACPCALGLATPLTIMVATGKAALNGILIKNAESLELMAKVDTLVVDKTGTLTEGKASVNEIITFGNDDKLEMLQLAASVESRSEHPLAKAIVNKAKSEDLKFSHVESFQSMTGSGVEATVNSKKIVIASYKFVQENYASLKLPDDLIEQKQGEASTLVFMLVENKLAAIFCISDQIKAGSADVIKALHQQGIKIVMLSGDNEQTARAIGEKLGIDTIIGDVLPQDKAAEVKRLQSEGRVVAMAGDGINDAPALAQADIGIAMGTGTDVAIESAGLTLVSGDLRGILNVRKLSQASVKNIKQNLLLAFGYNTLGIPIAAGLLFPFFGLLLSPIIASAAMSLSSVSVIGNALRLKMLKLDA